MPPDQFTWDRRDFRRQDRSGSDPRFGGGGPHRWREQQHNPYAPTPFNPNSHQPFYSDFRSSRPISAGHIKQGGWHMYPEEAGHVFMPFGSRYSDRNVEDDNFRPFGSRGDGRHPRNNREHRGSFSQKDWRSRSREPAAPSVGPGRPTIEVNNQKSVESTQTCHYNNNMSCDSAHSNPDSIPGQTQPLLREKHEKNVESSDVLASCGQKPENEGGPGLIDWKPLKWSRSGSLSSRSSGFSHSSSSKSQGVDSSETTIEVKQMNIIPIQSAAVVSNAPAPLYDETTSRKKPRLGWGEGLAKYEKKKVESPEDDAARDRLVDSSIHTETVQSPYADLLDKSPTVASLSNCTSPATPSSVACSSSPGIDEKESTKAENGDQDTVDLSCSPSIMSQMPFLGPAFFNLENLELASIANLNSSINELLQFTESSPVETGVALDSLLNKLLVCKVDVLKALEVTEYEIDSLETELRSLTRKPEGCCPCPAASSLLPGECLLKPCREHVSASGHAVVCVPLPVVSSQGMVDKDLPATLEKDPTEMKNVEIDSPGTETSKCVESFVQLDLGNSTDLNQTCSENSVRNGDKMHYIDVPKLITSNCQNFASVGNNLYDAEGLIYHHIWSSNKDLANGAMEELSKLLTGEKLVFDSYTASRASSAQRDSLVTKKFLLRKSYLKFVEKVITLKFKVFQHFWKEGRVVSMKKLRAKSDKMLDASRAGYKRNRSSGRSQISYSAGTSRTVPAEEVAQFVRWLLGESPFRHCRETLKMPALILDKEEVMISKFISNNGLVEDPCAAEKERSIINRWTAEERETFIDKLAVFGKIFGKIASFLEHKTIADCIEFYYKNHKSECFVRALKKSGFPKQKQSHCSTYLVAARKRWNREANAANLDILGEASIIAANHDGLETLANCTSKIYSSACSSQKTPRGDDMYNSETAAVDVLAGICGSLSSEAMSSCITGSFGPADGCQDCKYPLVSSSIKRPLTPDVTEAVDDECSDVSFGEIDSTDWTDAEKSVFIQAVSSYGNDFLMISQLVGTRSKEQCKIFFSKARKRLGLDQIHLGASNVDSGDVNGGDSDVDDGCILQNETVIGNDNSKSEMEEDLLHQEMMTCDTSGITVASNLGPDVNAENIGACHLDSTFIKPNLKNSPVDDKSITDFRVGYKQDNDANGACGSKQKVEKIYALLQVEHSDSEQPCKSIDSDNKHLSKQESDANDACGSKQEVGKKFALLQVEHSVNEQTCKSVDSDNKNLYNFPDEHRMEENEEQGQVLPESLVSEKVEYQDANTRLATSSCTIITCSDSRPFIPEHSSIQVKCGKQVEADLQFCAETKPHAILFQQNGRFVPVDSSEHFSIPVDYQRYLRSNLLHGSANGIDEKYSQKIVGTGDCQRHLPAKLLEPVKSSQILRGYPVSMQSLKEINVEDNCKKPAPLRNLSKQDGLLHMDFSLQKCTSSGSEVRLTPCPPQEHGYPAPMQTLKEINVQDNCKKQAPLRNLTKQDGLLHMDFSLQKCKSSGSEVSLTPCPPQEHGCMGNSESQSSFTPDSDEPSRNGDVKLFGKILVSSQQKAKSSLQDTSDDNTQHHKAGGQPLTIKYQKVILDSCKSSFDGSKYVGSENIPVGRLNFWDGMSTQMGIPPVPDSTLLLAKYPAAFSNHSTSTVKFRKPPPRGLSVFPIRDSNSSNSMGEFQVLRNRGMQPFTIDMKPPDVFSELQRRNGGAATRNQGVFRGVQDPVTALKMHYAKAQNFGMQAGNVVRDNYPWGSNGDLGR